MKESDKNEINKEDMNENELDDFNEDIIRDKKIQHILNKLEHTPFVVNRLDYYGNSIPLGAFCFAVSFILIGFIECGIFNKYDTFTFSVILLFGGIGQITSGILEYIKSRTYLTIIYLLYGLYFITFFLCIIIKMKFMI